MEAKDEGKGREDRGWTNGVDGAMEAGEEEGRERRRWAELGSGLSEYKMSWTRRAWWHRIKQLCREGKNQEWAKK